MTALGSSSDGKPRLLLTRPLPEPAPSILGQVATLEVLEQDLGRAVEPGRLSEAVLGARLLLPQLTESIERRVLEAAGPQLLGVATMSVGYDHVDVAAATELGLPIANTPGVLTETTADLTWALILAVTRRVVEAHQMTVQGRFQRWGPSLMLGADVGPGPRNRPKVLGIVGFGRIGQAVARRATGFGMRVLAHDPRHRAEVEESELANWASLEETIEQSDVLSLHAPLKEGTRHLLSSERLRSMRRGAVVINTARGALIDEQALVRALHEGWIAGAGLDVYEHEPALAPGLAEQKNVVLLPHIGSASHDTRQLMAEITANNALALMAGRPALHTVNPEVYRSAAYARRLGTIAAP